MFKIVSFATRNPERQLELAEGVAKISDGQAEVYFAVDEDDAMAALADAEILHAHRLTPQQFAAGPQLQWIHLSSAGVDHSLFEPFINSDVVLTNSRGLHAQPMAEWVLGGLLYWSQQFFAAEAWRRTREWEAAQKADDRRATNVEEHDGAGSGLR
ncbi:MAG: hypothetical protein IPG71_06905 [bacterium]|nr:hypothetical protein [bacterium]